MFRHLLLLLLILPAGLAAQQTCVVKGQVVYNENGEPMPYCVVRLLDKKGQTVTAAQSDPDGFYSMKTATPGTYSLVATFPVYDTVRLDVVARAGIIVEKNIRMKPSHTASRKASDTIVYEVPPIELEGIDRLIQQRGVNFTGKLEDAATGEAIPFAVVTIASDSYEPRFAQADTAGRFSIRLMPGEYRVGASYPGYNKEILPVYLHDAGCHVTIRLSAPVIRCADTVVMPPHNRPPVKKHLGSLPARSGFPSPRIKLQPIDTLAISRISKTGHDSVAAAMLGSGRLYRLDDSTFYFRYGFTKQTAVYRLRGETLEKIAWTCPAPAAFTFRKTKSGWRIQSLGGTKARVK